jgi:hypothetical protein
VILEGADMTKERRSPFFLNGKQNNWTIGKKRAIWGLPLHGKKWPEVKALLQELGFVAGAEILAISGPYAHFRAVIGSDRGFYYDDSCAPWGFGPRNDIYPVRFELTNIQEINRDWFDGPRGDYWRGPLEDVYFSMKSLYMLSSKRITDIHVNQGVVFDTERPSAAFLRELHSPDSFEDVTAQTFAQLGYTIERLGHTHTFQRVPDGIGMLPRSLAVYAKQQLNTHPYFVLWDCKFDCGSNGLKAGDERAIKEYIESYAPTRKADASAGEFWFLIVARNKSVADKIHHGAAQWSWLAGCQQYGLRGLRVMSLQSLERLLKAGVEHRQTGIDSDSFLLSILPREFAKPYLG